MAENIVQSMFGPTPYQIQQAQQAQIGQAASNYAQLDPLQRAAQSMYQGGAGLGQLGAGMLGMVNPQVEEAKQREAAFSGIDVNDPQSLLQRAQQIQDPRLKMQLQMLAQQRQAEMSAMALEAAKTKYQEAQATELPQMRHEETMLRLQQTAELAKQRSEDARLSIQQRAEAAREANQTRLLIAQLVSQTGKEKPLTEMQKITIEKQKTAAKQALSGIEDTLSNLTNEAKAIKEHPGLERATGIMATIPSVPGTEASKAENLITEFKAGVKMAGLNLVRQGGSIGQMTEREWPIVEAMVAAIDPKAGKSQLKSQMDKVLAKVEQIRNNSKTAYEDLYGTNVKSEIPQTPKSGTWKVVR